MGMWTPSALSGASLAASSFPVTTNSEEGLRVVLSPVQLAAVLQGENISAHEILVNRLWGGAKVIGGALELVGGGALLLAPEPTTLTKVGCTALAAHGVDTLGTGAREVWTGEPTKTLTQRAGEAVLYPDSVSGAVRSEGKEAMAKGHAIELRGEREFPELYALMGGSFHQDFDIDGNTLDEVVGAFKIRTSPEIWQGVQADIKRFIAERPDDNRLTKDFEEYFRPDVLPEGWEPDITNWRQWLGRVAQLLEASPAQT